MGSLTKLNHKLRWDKSNEGVDPPDRITPALTEGHVACWIANCRFNLNGRCELKRIPHTVGCAKIYYDEVNH